jgi:hypothetical protein
VVVIDCDPDDLGRAAAPIDTPAEPALRRSLLYVTMPSHLIPSCQSILAD